MKKSSYKEDSVHFYYTRVDGNRPIACSAIVEIEDGKIARGVSICSKNDKFNKTAARNIASYRLRCALANKFSIPFAEYAGQNAARPLEAIELPELHMKMAYGVTPTKYEHRILHKPEDK